MFQIKVVEEIKTHICCSVTFKNSRVFYEIMWEKYCRAGQWQYGACTFHAGYLRLQKHTQNMQYLLLFHCNNGSTKAPQSYVTRTLTALFGFHNVLDLCTITKLREVFTFPLQFREFWRVLIGWDRKYRVRVTDLLDETWFSQATQFQVVCTTE